ncbi:hypothetical protein J1N35_011945, partial [Gossypium stocksii]
LVQCKRCVVVAHRPEAVSEDSDHAFSVRSVGTLGMLLKGASTAPTSFAGPPSSVPQEYFSGGNFWSSVEPNPQMANRVSNPFVGVDDNISVANRPHGGSKTPFDLAYISANG